MLPGGAGDTKQSWYLPEVNAAGPLSAGCSSSETEAILQEMARAIDAQVVELNRILGVQTTRAGLPILEGLLNRLFEDFHNVIPYNRIGLAVVQGEDLRSIWCRTDQPKVVLGVGYAAPLRNSTLENVLRTGEPRVLNDLNAYLRAHPESISTRKILAEGIRSSLTCPLSAYGKRVGVLFFSSVNVGTYLDVHVKTFTDIAERVSLFIEKSILVADLEDRARTVRRQNQELRQANELKNQFVGMAAHDLRGPLTQVQWASEMLLDGVDRDLRGDGRLHLETIRRLSNHMCSLVNNILDISLIESGRLVLERQPCQLHELLQEAIGDHQRLAYKKDVTIEAVGSEERVIVIDRARIRQVLDNLISNAVRYSPSGSWVAVQVERTAGFVRIAVRDRGPGIPAAECSRLFQDFQRLQDGSAEGEGNTGLGLAIAKRIVTAHGGEIGVELPADGGSLFWFTLPA